MLKKTSVIVAILVLLVTLSTAAQEVPPHGANFSGELTIAVWGQIDADPGRGDAYGFHQVLQQWDELYPNVSLKYMINGGTSVPEQFTWINTNLLAGTLPDIVMIYFPGADILGAGDLIYDFNPDLDKPNPYSSNPTWRDDFPLDGLILSSTVSPDGGHRVVGPTQSGDTGVTVYAYNRDIFNEVGVQPPKTWGEFMDIQQKIKDAGYIPFLMPMAGPLGWIWGWGQWIMQEQLMDEVVRSCDFREPFDMMSQEELTYCVLSGKLSGTDPRFAETWRLMKEWSQYWQNDFLAPPPEGDLFAQGKVAMVNTMNLWLGQIANNPNINFEWGTFYHPAVTPADSEYGNDILPRRMGNNGAPGGGSIYVFIPTTTIQRSQLQFEMARDLAQWITAPEQVEYWCSKQAIPCFEPGTPIEEVYKDKPEMVARMRGFFEPGAFRNGIRGFTWGNIDRSLDAEHSRLFAEYMGNALSLEEALEEFDLSVQDIAQRTLRNHPEWDQSTWPK